MLMTAVVIERYAYEMPAGGEYTFALSGAERRRAEVAPTLQTGEIQRVVSRKASRKMAYATWLAVEATARCVRDISEQERACTPIFCGFPTGVEMTHSFLQSMSELANVERSQLHARMLGGNAGPIVDYLKYSVGNAPGHLAEHTGLRGPNACFTGFGADLSALRKARLLLEAGVIERAVVVAAEGSAGVAAPEYPPAEPSAIGVAVLLSRRVGVAQAGLLLDVPASQSTVPEHIACFEACSALANIAWALERGAASGTMEFHQEDRWQRRAVYGVTWESTTCAG